MSSLAREIGVSLYSHCYICELIGKFKAFVKIYNVSTAIFISIFSKFRLFISFYLYTFRAFDHYL